MRTLFPGTYAPTPEEFQKLWRDGLIVLDANILLNVYRYSPTTREDFLRLLGSLKDRIWVPHQAAAEYQRNRLDEILAQERVYRDLVKKLRGAVDSFAVGSWHPVVQDDLIERFQGVATELIAALETQAESIAALI